MKKLIKLLSFLSFSSVAQSCQTEINSRRSDRFDQVIKMDKDFQIDENSEIPKSLTIDKIESESPLVYSEEINFWNDNLKEILDNPRFSELQKIELIETVLNDSSRDVFNNIRGKAISYWLQSKEVKKLIDNYFTEKNYQISDDLNEKYKYFEFKTKSLYPETYELITDYFENRPNKGLRYKYEGDLVYRLVQLNKHQEALHYLEILIEEYINGNSTHLPEIGSRNDYFHDGYVFDFLCFSDQTEIKKKATNLLFYLLENKDYGTYYLYPLTAYLDLNRHIKLLEKRFEYFKTVDFSPIKDYASNPDIKNNWRNLVPKANAFYDFIFINSIHLGKTKGKELWQTFKETMPYWNLYQSIEMNQMYILENCFQDRSLTQSDKINILKEAKLTKRLFEDRDLYGSYKARFLNLLVKTFPDKDISKQIHYELGLDGFIEYSYLQNITEDDLEPNPFRKKLEPNQIDEIVNDINRYAESYKIQPIELTDQNRFSYSIGSPEALIFDFFHKRDLMSWFDAESSMSPTNYKEFYELEFKKVLEENTQLELNVRSKSEQTDEDYFKYEIHVNSEYKNYTYRYEEHGTDWYNPQRLVKMINLQLINSGEKKRLVSVDSGDQTAIFILSEPNVLKELLSKYDIDCWAVTYGDEFQYE